MLIHVYQDHLAGNHQIIRDRDERARRRRGRGQVVVADDQHCRIATPKCGVDRIREVQVDRLVSLTQHVVADEHLKGLAGDPRLKGQRAAGRGIVGPGRRCAVIGGIVHGDLIARSRIEDHCHRGRRITFIHRIGDTAEMYHGACVIIQDDQYRRGVIT